MCAFVTLNKKITYLLTYLVMHVLSVNARTSSVTCSVSNISGDFPITLHFKTSTFSVNSLFKVQPSVPCVTIGRISVRISLAFSALIAQFLHRRHVCILSLRPIFSLLPLHTLR